MKNKLNCYQIGGLRIELMLKVLHIINTIDLRDGGPVASLYALARARLASGHSTTAISLDAPGSLNPEELPFNWVALGPGTGNYGYSPRLVPWLKEHAREYDSVIISGIWGFQAFGGWKGLKGLNIPYLLFPHGMLDPWFKNSYPLKHVKKWFYWHWFLHQVFRDASAVCFTCEQERGLARQSFWRYKAAEVVVGYGIQEPPASSQSQFDAFQRMVPAALNKRIILFLSRIHEKKGCDLLVQSYAKVMGADSNWHLVIAGPADEKTLVHLKAIARKAGIGDSVSWPGMLYGDAKWGAFRSADAFCLPSHQENFGIVVAEAMACECPALITHQVNIWRDIYESAAGFVEPDTAEGIEHLLRRWRENPVEKRQAMGARGRECQKRLFDIRGVDSRLEALMRQSIRGTLPDVHHP